MAYSKGAIGPCNVDKTEVQHVGRGNRAVNIKIDDRPLKQVENFVYLGGNMSEDASVEHDVRRRIGLATGVMQSLNKIWQNKRIGQATKVKIYETLVLSVLLYNSETWTMKEATKNSVLVFEMGCLRKILGVSRRNHIRNLDIRAALNVEVDVVRKIQRRRLKYFGHVTRMEGSRFPNLALYGRVHGHRERGRPRKRSGQHTGGLLGDKPRCGRSNQTCGLRPRKVEKSGVEAAGACYCIAKALSQVKSIGPCPFRAKKSVFNKRKKRKTWLASFIYLFKQFFEAFKCGHKLILVDSSYRKRP